MDWAIFAIDAFDWIRLQAKSTTVILRCLGLMEPSRLILVVNVRSLHALTIQPTEKKGNRRRATEAAAKPVAFPACSLGGRVVQSQKLNSRSLAEFRDKRRTAGRFAYAKEAIPNIHANDARATTQER